MPGRLAIVTQGSKGTELKAEGERAFRRVYFGTFGVLAALLSIALVVWMPVASFDGIRLWVNEVAKPEPVKSSNPNPSMTRTATAAS